MSTLQKLKSVPAWFWSKSRAGYRGRFIPSTAMLCRQRLLSLNILKSMESRHPVAVIVDGMSSGDQLAWTNCGRAGDDCHQGIPPGPLGTPTTITTLSQGFLAVVVSRWGGFLDDVRYSRR